MSRRIRVLFLDFDGVLNSGPYLRRSGVGEDAIDPAAVAILNRVVEVARCEVAISSSWRLAYPLEKIRSMLSERDFDGPICGFTPDLSTRRDGGFLYTSPERGHEIQAWLDAVAADWSFEVESFVIVDDDADMAHLAHRLVRTSFETGLTEREADRIIEMFDDSPPPTPVNHGGTR